MADGIDLKGFPELRGQVTRMASLLGEDANAFRNLGAVVGAYQQEDIQNSFLDEKDPVTGKSWAPLSPATTSRHGRGGSSSRRLQDTNNLQRSVSAIEPAVSGDTVTIALANTNKRYPGSNKTVGEIAEIHNGPITGALRAPLSIKPRQASHLWIPKSKEAVRYGSDIRRFFAAMGKKVVTIKNATGGVVIEKKSGGGKVIHYTLTDEVTLPTSRFMGFGERHAKDIAAIVSASIGQAIKDKGFLGRVKAYGKNQVNRLLGRY